MQEITPSLGAEREWLRADWWEFPFLGQDWMQWGALDSMLRFASPSCLPNDPLRDVSWPFLLFSIISLETSLCCWTGLLLQSPLPNPEHCLWKYSCREKQWELKLGRCGWVRLSSSYSVCCLVCSEAVSAMGLQWKCGDLLLGEGAPWALPLAQDLGCSMRSVYLCWIWELYYTPIWTLFTVPEK